MSEVQNDIQIRQKDVDDFTEEEKKFFENAFIRKDPIKIVRTQNNPIILRENEEFKGEVPILKKLQHTEVQDHLNNTYHILMVNPGTTAIVTNNNTNILDSETNRPTSISTTKDSVSPEVKQLAGDIAIQTLNKQRTGTRSSSEEEPVVKIAIVNENYYFGTSTNALDKCKSFVDAVKKQQTNKKLPDPTESFVYDEYTATCHCNRPDVKNKEGKETIQCGSCKTLTHRKCIDEEINEIDIMCGDYKCAPCTVNIDGVVWAEGKGAKDTCPVDNTITHFALRASMDLNFKEEIQMLTESAEPAVKAFGDSVIHAVNNNSAKSHAAWLEVLKNDPNGLDSKGTWFGGTDEKMYGYVDKQLSRFTQNIKTHCNDTCTISKAVTEPKEIHEASINLTTNPVKYFNKKSEVFADTTWPCQQAGFGQSCKGEVTFGPMEIQVELAHILLCLQGG